MVTGGDRQYESSSTDMVGLSVTYAFAVDIYLPTLLSFLGCIRSLEDYMTDDAIFPRAAGARNATAVHSPRTISMGPGIPNTDVHTETSHESNPMARVQITNLGSTQRLKRLTTYIPR